MAINEAGKLVKLSDTDETISRGDEDIRGYTVRDKNGEELGKVDDLLIDEIENKVRFLEIGSGGFLGIGKEKSFVPVDVITEITDEEVRIDQAREHVAAAPEYDPDLVYDQPYYDDVFSYYGYAPYWSTGYRYPAYPYYR